MNMLTRRLALVTIGFATVRTLYQGLLNLGVVSEPPRKEGCGFPFSRFGGWGIPPRSSYADFSR